MPIRVASPALTLAGGGIDGTLGFSPVGGDQKIEAHLTANGRASPAAGLRGPLGSVDGTIVLAEGADSRWTECVGARVAASGEPPRRG